LPHAEGARTGRRAGAGRCEAAFRSSGKAPAVVVVGGRYEKKRSGDDQGDADCMSRSLGCELRDQSDA